MPAAPKQDSAEAFVGSVFKFSVSTFANIGIYGLALLLTNLFLPHGANGQITLFLGGVNTIMTIAILGLDQSLIRFYHEAPAGLSKNGLFRVCFYFSGAVLLVAGVAGSTLLSGVLYNAIGFEGAGPYALSPSVVPMMFLGAFFFMVARYFNVLYRMEMNIRVYTVESILMQFFYKLFYVMGALFGLQNPVPAMVVCSVVGLGAFALVFSALRRKALSPHLAEFTGGALRTVLPYGMAVAPTAVFMVLGGLVPNSIIGHSLGIDILGVYVYAYSLSNIVTLVQGGFASFWGAYMFQNYKTHQQRAMKVHDFLTFVILVFFACLVAFEDVIFFVLRNYAAAQPIFPLMMLSAVFTILCEGTVYGNAIARRPIFDTIGIGISLALNVLLCVLLVPRFGLYGAATAVAMANLAMFLFRTLTAQRLYRTVRSPAKTALAIALAMAIAVAGTVFAASFWLKLLACATAATVYCLIYREELLRCIRLAGAILQSLFKRKKT